MWCEDSRMGGGGGMAAAAATCAPGMAAGEAVEVGTMTRLMHTVCVPLRPTRKESILRYT